LYAATGFDALNWVFVIKCCNCMNLDIYDKMSYEKMPSEDSGTVGVEMDFCIVCPVMFCNQLFVFCQGRDWEGRGIGVPFIFIVYV
jgi:hypothetical protein